jgi:hypothetical protein
MDATVRLSIESSPELTITWKNDEYSEYNDAIEDGILTTLISQSWSPVFAVHIQILESSSEDPT